jgi:polygalacturonase
MNIKKYLVIAIFYLVSARLYAKDYPVSFFGIHSDGVTLNTRSIQFAIDYINKNGGGRLIFHVGRYLTGSIHLKSCVILQLQEGAVLLGSLNPFDYDRELYMALVFAYNQHDIGITGKGIIDGQGRYVARNFVDIIDKGLIKDLFRNGRPEAFSRPMLINFHSCENALIHGVTLRNSSSWVQTYDQCKNLKLDSIYVDSKAFWNNDGLDIVDCDSVSITHCYVDAADDGICLKSHDSKAVCKNVLISNCTIRSSASAIKFGTASRGGFSNIHILNNKVFDTYRSALALEAVDGGFIENVEVDSLQVFNTGNVIFLRIGERVAEKKGRLENVKLSNIYAEVAASKPDAGYEYEGPVEDLPRNISPAIIIAGLPNKVITNISLNNIEIEHPGGGNPVYAKVSLDSLDRIPELIKNYPEFSMFGELPAWGVYIRHARNIQCSNITLSCKKKDYRIPLVLDDTHQSKFISLKLKQPDKKKEFYLNKSTEIVIK